ncbi:MAG: CesT family type III secretion system chaperone [Candidatus Accumulibacter sp.]|nr:CesT family type III secretion system chaperone [Accumulibacter sp.]
MLFEDILKEFGQATGIGDLVLDDEGSCSLSFDGGQEITLTFDAREEAVFFYARVADAGILREADACRRLLAASCLGAETGGAAFALYGNSVLLWKRHENLADEPALEKAINAFLPALIEWREKLAKTTDSGPSASPVIEPSYQGMGLLV